MKNEVLFFDTSALLKRFLNEKGSARVISLFDQTKSIVVSPITQIECVSAFRRLLHTGEINKTSFNRLCLEVAIDFKSYHSISFDAELEKVALNILEEYPMKAGDTIQFASLMKVKSEIDAFIVCDQQLKKYAALEGLKTIDPLL